MSISLMSLQIGPKMRCRSGKIHFSNGISRSKMAFRKMTLVRIIGDDGISAFSVLSGFIRQVRAKEKAENHRDLILELDIIQQILLSNAKTITPELIVTLQRLTEKMSKAFKQ